MGYCIGEKVRGEVNYICLYICWLSFLFLFFLALNLLLFCAKPGEVDSGVEMTCLSLALTVLKGYFPLFLFEFSREPCHFSMFVCLYIRAIVM